MTNRKNWLGVLVIVLVFGMTVVGCGDGGGGETDPALNGTWGYTDGSESGKFTFNNGNFEATVDENGVTEDGYKGTYTTSGNKITFQFTHLYYESKWLSKTDFKEMGASDSELNEMFTPQKMTYSISGNTLTMTNSEGSALILTKQ